MCISLATSPRMAALAGASRSATSTPVSMRNVPKRGCLMTWKNTCTGSSSSLSPACLARGESRFNTPLRFTAQSHATTASDSMGPGWSMTANRSADRFAAPRAEGCVAWVVAEQPVRAA